MEEQSKELLNTGVTRLTPYCLARLQIVALSSPDIIYMV